MRGTRQSRSLQELASAVGARIRGPGSTLITGVASIGSARSGDLVFAADEKRLQQARLSQASAIVTGGFAEDSSDDKAYVIAENP